MHQLWPPRWTRSSPRSSEIQADARRNGFTATAALADDRPAHAQGLDRPARWSTASRSKGTFRAHQVPMGDMDKPEHIKILERWMKSYRPRGAVRRSGQAAAGAGRAGPAGRAPHERQSRTPTAALLLRDLRMPDFRDYAVDVPKPGAVDAEATRVQGQFLRDVIKLNAEHATSASSAPTRPPPTAGAPSSR